MSESKDPVLSPKAIIFDMDGLMFDTEHLYFESEEELLRRRGRSFSIDLAQRMMGIPAPKAMEMLRSEHGLCETSSKLLAEFLQTLISKFRTRLRMMPGLAKFLELTESRGWPKAVATSTYRELTDQMLGRFDLHHRFSLVVTGEDVTHGKPDPEIYTLTCRELGILPQDALVLEDSLNGARSAKAAGCRCVAIPHELSRSLDFSLADLVVDHLLDTRLLQYCGLVA